MNKTEARTMIYRRNIIELLAVCFVALLFGKCEMTMKVYGINQPPKGEI